MKNIQGLKVLKIVTFLLFYQRIKFPWHVDLQNKDIFSPAAITSLVTDDSFIEFEDDKKYTYKLGHSYLIKSGNRHRIMNLSKTNRYTLCVTPEENPYV